MEAAFVIPVLVSSRTSGLVRHAGSSCILSPKNSFFGNGSLKKQASQSTQITQEREFAICAKADDDVCRRRFVQTFIAFTAATTASFTIPDVALAARKKKKEKVETPAPAETPTEPAPVVEKVQTPEDEERAIQAEIIRFIEEYDNAPAVLRLAFHDAGCGGADGSVRFDGEAARPENGGLGSALDMIKKIKQFQTNDVSWADLIAIAGAAAVKKSGGPEILVGFGRKDGQKECPEGELPAPTTDIFELKQLFVSYGLTPKDLVALSGAHTLGKYTAAKGKKKSWTTDPDKFNNSYFQVLLGIEQGKVLPSAVLQTDAVLLKDEELRPLVEKYAADEAVFFKDFAAAYKKMTRARA